MNPPLPRPLLRNLAALATEVAARLEASFAEGCERLAVARTSLETALGREIPAAECADMLSQAMVASFPLVMARKDVFAVAAPWLLEQAKPWERLVLDEVFGITAHWLRVEEIQQALSTKYSVLSTQYLVPGTQQQTPITPHPDLTHLFEHFLAEHCRLHRKRGGVFYTPPELVQFITRRVHQQLQEEFGIERGLADATILDPAAGTGAFLLGAIDFIHSEFPASENWSEFVSWNLLPRLHGLEIIPAAVLAAQLNIAVKLADTGFDFEQPGRIRVELGNTLADDHSSNLQSAILNLQSPLVLLGNPPFSSLSGNRGKWITDLVHGSSDRPGYIVTADERLGEKKTWLHDDYVKFIRYAQWLIEETGSGIVGFVTNHGYLDNVTFRLMRGELLRVFSRLEIVDLHGNRKKGETKRGREGFSREETLELGKDDSRKPLPTPSGMVDENVFGLDQGVAVGFFRRLPKQTVHASCRIRHAELWGTREDKLRRLATEQSPIPTTNLTPTPPNFLFTPAPPPMPPEYASAWRLPEAMPVNTTAPVTARDHFVVAHSREELCRRIAEFRDLTIPDEEIRSRYFTRTRSAKYPPGDTRSWQLPAARRIIAAEDNWQSCIRRCLYRPFDWRFVFWHKAMIDWPRTGVVERLQIEDCRLQNAKQSSAICNLKSAILISRRQMLPTQPCSFFWIADTLALDGVIRSDNRGSESLFPLYLKSLEDDSPGVTANFAAPFIATASSRLVLDWLPNGSGDLTTTFGPEDLLHYIYALFHSPTYRERYAAELRTDFPRILLPKDKSLFGDLVPCGARLVQWHTLRAPAPALNGVTEFQLQQFRAGGHQPLRPSRPGSGEVLAHPLAPYIDATVHEMSAIDEAILRWGGWPNAFEPFGSAPSIPENLSPKGLTVTTV
ncbi:MAG: N-6 DNA methylase [Planctomycetales bacterium]|nr:N-6 DNA methylase [Planctomycetales bacterium]